MNWPTGLFLSAAIIGILTDKMHFMQKPRINHSVTAVMALLATASMVLSAVRFWHRPDGGPIGTAVGGFLLVLFLCLFGLSFLVNGYKAITGRERVGVWKF